MYEKEFLAELMRGKDQKIVIRDIKRMEDDIRELHRLIEHDICDPVRFIFEDVVKVIAKELNVDWNEIIDDWFPQKQYRVKMYKKYKQQIDSEIKKKAAPVMKGILQARKRFPLFVKKVDELNKYVEDNKDVYDQIKVRWYNVFGGPVKDKVEYSNKQKESFVKGFKKLNNQMILKNALGIDYIMGKSDAYASMDFELIVDAHTHRHALMDY